jgi:Leucine-rich repeat (LRR) protein
MDIKIFEINRYITVKFEDNETVIYFNGEEFLQCKYLLLNIPLNNISEFDEIMSVDEAAEKLNNSLEPNGSVGKPFKIPPKVEFWGHCSNLQVWAENNYDSRLVHRNLAFPLLKKLVEVGDPVAKKVFKNEIAKRFAEGNETVRNYLIDEDYMEFLERDELWSILPEETEILSEIENKINIKFQLGTQYWSTNPNNENEILFSLKDNNVYRILFSKCHFNDNIWDWIFRKLQSLKNLKILSIKFSELKKLPEAIGELELLERLILSGNQLENLPNSILNLKSLKLLSLKNNNYREIPTQLLKLHSLEKLNLKYNPLNQKPKLISNLKNLKYLYY